MLRGFFECEGCKSNLRFNTFKIIRKIELHPKFTNCKQIKKAVSGQPRTGQLFGFGCFVLVKMSIKRVTRGAFNKKPCDFWQLETSICQ